MLGSAVDVLRACAALEALEVSVKLIVTMTVEQAGISVPADIVDWVHCSRTDFAEARIDRASGSSARVRPKKLLKSKNTIRLIYSISVTEQQEIKILKSVGML